MIDWCVKNGNPPPVWKEQAGAVYVTFLLATLPETHRGTPQVTPQVQKLIDGMVGEMTRTELMDAVSLKDRMHFSREYLQPALQSGLIEMTIPDKPRSSKQQYRLTQQGISFLQNREQK